jgi:hypothetical protein
MPRPNTQGDFWASVDIGQPDECWPWLGAVDHHGYGRFSLNNRPRGAHRLALKFSGVDLPDNKCALHRCDNPPCCNPFHLFAGTKADNTADMHKKGRGFVPSAACGSQHRNAKLNEEQVLAIRSFKGSQVSAAKAFGVSQGTVWRIQRGLAWRHI